MATTMFPPTDELAPEHSATPRSTRRPSRATARRERRHGDVLAPADRRALERAGWRTTLEYREDHVRGRDGRLVRVRPVWVAEAERYGGPVRYASVTAASVEDVWARLRAEAGVA